MQDAQQKMSDAGATVDPRERQIKMRDALQKFQNAKEQGLELQLMRSRRARLLDAPNPDNGSIVPNAPRNEPPTVAQREGRPQPEIPPFDAIAMNARIQNALNLNPNSPLSDSEFDDRNLKAFVDGVANGTANARNLKEFIVRKEQEFNVEKASRISAVRNVSRGGLQSIINEQTVAKRESLQRLQRKNSELATFRGSQADRRTLVQEILAEIYKAKLADFRVQNAQRRASELNEPVQIPAPPPPPTPPRPINFEQVKNAPRVNNGMDAINQAVEDAWKVVIAQETVAVRRAEAQQRWDLIRRTAVNALVREEVFAVRRLSELSRRDHRDEMQLRARNAGVAFNSKEEAQQKLQEAQERLVAITRNPNAFSDSASLTQIKQLIQQATGLKQTVDNWDADSAVIERATNPNATKYFDPNAPEMQQKREGLGNIATALQRNIDTL